MIEVVPNTSSAVRIVALRPKEVISRTGLSKTHLYRLVKKGQFPPPRKLSERASAWTESEVNGWLRDRLVER